jgi:GMP synthase (glutamine-hydrolysing)
MAIIVFQHSEANRAGRLGVVLRDHAHHLDVRRLDLGDPVPPDFDDVSGVISLGGPQNVGDGSPWMDAEAEYLRAAHERQLPVVGVCLGAQLIAHALGGEVGPMGAPEGGFFDITLSGAAHVDTAFAGIVWTHKTFCHHGYEIKTLPAGATNLASSEACAVQAFKAGMRTYAFQFHFEADAALALAINGQDGSAILDPDDLRAQLETHYATFARLSDRLCENLAAHVFPAAKLVGASGG